MNTLKEIKGFFNEYAFLSNFYLCTIEFEGLIYPSVEHAYQAAKTLNIDLRKELFLSGSASQVKRKGKCVELRNDWEEVKLSIMKELCTKKFSIPQFREKLLLTENAYLEETNWWRDKFWGVYQGEGLNHLGKILMEIRDYLVSHADKDKPIVLNKRNKTNLSGVYVGRPTIYGNPFVVGKDGDYSEVVRKYKEYILSKPDFIALVKKELKGLNLICWCTPKPCHADILLEVANN